MKEDEFVWRCNTRGRDEKCINTSGRKTEGKKPLRRPRHRWKDNIKWILWK